MKLDDVLTEDERLDLWAEMMALSTMMQEYCDWWWRLDAGMRRANNRRCNGCQTEPACPKISD